MGSLRRKIWFDLWHNKGRTLLMILSIAAGIFAIGAIFGMVDQLLSGMDNAHRLVKPAHINMILRGGIDQATVDDLKSIPGVDDIDPVNQVSIQYKIHPEDKWKLGTLIERPDYTRQTYDVVELKDGQWPQDGTLGIERLSSAYFDLPVNSQVIFQVDGKEKTYTIDGKIRHPFVQPPQFGGQANFFTDAQGLEDFGVPTGYFGQLLVRIDDPYSLQRAQDIAGELRSRLGDQGHGVVITLYQDPDKHWGRIFVEGVTLVLRLMAIIALFLSVVLVVNTMTALVSQQTDQIGVIKAIGGQSGVIMQTYFSEVLVLGALALVIALPLSLAFAFFMTQNFLNLFNIDYNQFVVSTRSIVLMVMAALLAPLAAALWPVLKGAAISVREAIATYGLGSDFGSSRFDRLLEHFSARFLNTLYSAALGNLFRRKGRLLFTLFVLTAAGVTFLAVMSLVSSIKLTLDNETARQGYDVRIGFTTDQPSDKVQQTLAGITGISQSETWVSRNATLLRAGERLKDSAGLGAQLIGIPPETDMYHPLITSGRWLDSGDNGNVIVLNQETADKNNIRIGDMVTLDLGQLGSASWKVIGAYRTVYSTGFVVEPIYAPIAAVAAATSKPGAVTQAVVRGASIQNLAQETALLDRVKAAFEDQGISLDFYTTSAKRDARLYADNQFNTVVNMLVNLAFLMAMVGGIGLMGSLSISVVERTREIGILRAIGGKSHQIGGLFVMEGVLQGLLSFLISVPFAYLLAQPLARLLGQTMIKVDLDFAFNYPAVAIWLATVLVISIVFSLLPARNAARISVRESLSYA